ncbi:autotransporter domain-containing protein [Microvirga sp. W0021]|uniref:Autotransporter domain-containing protein n=1 Tax=Hohaiivirga grylli TaxID=3133970 RepID=A0ABV0BPM5_9HYPH
MKINKFKLFISASIVALSGMMLENTHSLQAQEYSFGTVGYIDGGKPSSNENYNKWLSPDGTIIIGTSSNPSGHSEAYRWTLSNGIQGLGFLGSPDGQYYFSEAVYGSKDGSVLVGRSSSTSLMVEAFRWTETTGMQSLGVLGGSTSRFSTAYWTSNDGSVVIGQSSNNDNFSEAFRWTQVTGMQGLGFLPGVNGTISYSSLAKSGSADGSVIVGTSGSRTADNTFYEEAFRWTAETGMQGIGILGSDRATSSSSAYKTNHDGSVIIGVAKNDLGIIEAFRWTAEAGIHGLGALTDMNNISGIASEPLDLSKDGSVVVGYSKNSSDFNEAFRWSVTDGMQNLGFINGGGATPISAASAVSGDGQVVVGVSTNPDAIFMQSAFRWTPETGMQSIPAILATHGIETGSLELIQATQISEDGQVIVGMGYDAAFNLETWIVRIPHESAIDGGSPPIDPTEPGTTVPDIDTGLPELPKSPDIGFISPSEAHATISNTAVKVLQVQNLPSATLADMRFAATEQCAPWENSDKRFCAFITGSGALWSNNGDYGNGNLFRGSAGISMNLLPGFSIGTAFTAGTGEYDLRLGGKNKISSYGVSLFATYAPAKTGLQLMGAVTTSWHDMDISRSYMNGSRATVLSKGSADGQSWGALGRIGWRFTALDRTWVMPYAEIEWTRSKIGGYQEEGGPFPFIFEGQTARELVSRFGIEFRHEFSDRFEIFGQAAWAYRLSGHANALKGVMVEKFNLSSGAISLPKKSWAELALGASWKITPDTRLSGSVSTAIGKSNRPDATVRIGVSTDF